MEIISLIKKNVLLSIFVLIALILTVVLAWSDVFIKDFTPTKTSPNNNSSIVTSDVGIPIYFYFPEEINKDTIKIKVFPPVNFVFTTGEENGEYFLKISPNPWWKYNEQYTVTIEKGLSSTSKSFSKQPIVLNFSLTAPTEENPGDSPEEVLPPPHLLK